LNNTDRLTAYEQSLGGGDYSDIDDDEEYISLSQAIRQYKKTVKNGTIQNKIK